MDVCGSNGAMSYNEQGRIVRSAGGTADQVTGDRTSQYLKFAGLAQFKTNCNFEMSV